MRKKILLTLLAGLLSGLSANAQLPVAKLSTLFPSGAKIGTSVEVTPGGSDLVGLRQAFFSHKGITGKVSSDGKKITMTVAKDVPEGVYSAWVAGDFGASNPRAIHVAQLNEVVSTTTNHDFDKAQVVAAGSIVNGYADKEKVDTYKVALKKGQRLLAQCLDKKLDSVLSGSVKIFDASRRELMRATNEEILDYTATADAHVFVQVSDRIFAGGTTYFYRLKLTTGPVVDFVLPLAVAPGANSKVKLYGRNLGAAVKSMTVDRKPLESKDAEISAPAASEKLPAGISLHDYQGAVTGFGSHGTLIGFAQAPVLLEAEPNNVATKPQVIKVPCDLSGQFYPARDRDYYTFDAKKGEVYWVEIISHRLGLSTDPLLVIQKVEKKAEGDWTAKDVFTLSDGDKNFGGPDYDTFHHDDDGKFTVAADGSYRIMIRDLFNGVKSDPRRLYRLIVRKESQDFQIVAQPIPRKAKTDRRDVWRSNTLLRQGDVEALNVLLFRKDGFTGEVNVEVEGLPAGVSHAPLKFTGSTKTAVLLLRAEESANPWTGSVKIVGKSKIGAKAVTRQARVASANWDIDYSAATTMKSTSRLSDQLILAVADEPSPLELIPASDKPIEAVIGTKVTVPVKVARRGSFAADLKVKPYGHAALAKVPDATVKKDAGNVVIDLKKYKLPEGTHQLHLKTNSKGKYRPASKELKAAEAASKAATDAAAAAEKHSKALAAVIKVKGLTAEQIAAVKKEADEAAKIAKDLVAKRDVAQKKAKDLAAKVKPKDYTVDFYSMPFLVTIKKK
ncbi:MAG: hypothetical protein ACPGVU_16000 [Limisphaerales bacterium]